MKTAETTGLRLILVLLVCFAVICGCKEKKSDVKDGIFPGLDAETERRILQDVADKYNIEADELYLLRIHHHIFVNDCIVVSMDTRGFAENTSLAPTRVVAGVVFNTKSPILVWKDGSLYALEDAYDLGLLPRETFPGLSEETKERILQVYSEAYPNPVLPFFIEPDRAYSLNKIVQHTVADGCDVVSILDSYRFNKVYRPFTPVYIGGMLFDNRLPAFVWKDGSLYDLSDAYDLGFLQKKD
jgi:hypothetical protein